MRTEQEVRRSQVLAGTELVYEVSGQRKLYSLTFHVFYLGTRMCVI